MALDKRFQTEIKNFSSTLTNIQNMRTSVIGLEEQMSVHTKAVKEITYQIEENENSVTQKLT